jgi:hypothetical protein
LQNRNDHQLKTTKRAPVTSNAIHLPGSRFLHYIRFTYPISGAAAAVTATTTFANGDVKYGDADCANDYLIIAGGSETGNSADLIYSRDRFCGKVLGYCEAQTTGTGCDARVGAVTTFTKPFILGVVTDSDEGADVTNPTDTANRGFNLLYSQQPCLSSG